jgi:hypothetical protein
MELDLFFVVYDLEKIMRDSTIKGKNEEESKTNQRFSNASKQKLK